MFDMDRIGKRIASLRKNKDMTQTELADRLGISFQAVSNWERGNSMPDISKLPELVEIFEVSLDELLGEKSPVMEAAVEGRLEERVKSGEIEEEELKNILPILKPKQIQNMAQGANMQTLHAFLPFMAEEDVADLAQETRRSGEDFSIYLPFMNEEIVAKWAREDRDQGMSISRYLPFINEGEVVVFAKEALQRGESVKNFLPFMNETNVKNLLMITMKK